MTRYVAPLALMAVALAVAVPTSAGAGSIVTSGYGEVWEAPDIVDIRLELAAVADFPPMAVGATAEKYGTVQAALEKIGIKQNDIVTTSFRVREWKDRNAKTGEIVYQGYEATHAIKITISDFAKIGPIVDAAMLAGTTRLSGLDFRINCPEPLNDAALKSAVQRALQSATLMAEAAGGRLGALVELNSEGRVDEATFTSFDAGSPAVPIVIVPDKIVVRKRVSAKWEFVEQ